MGKQELSGYSFPRVPERWSESERQFALGQRKLFDNLFGEQASLSRDVVQNNAKLSESISKLEKSSGEKINEITQGIDNIGKQLDEFDNDIGEIKEALTGIDTFITGITTWKSSIDNWKTDIETWKTGIGTWKTSVDGQLEGIIRNMLSLIADMNDVKPRLNGIPDLIYPIGITVFTQDDVNPPFSFGTWEVVTDPDTGTPVQDDFGHYMWQRVEDET